MESLQHPHCLLTFLHPMLSTHQLPLSLMKLLSVQLEIVRVVYDFIFVLLSLAIIVLH